MLPAVDTALGIEPLRLQEDNELLLGTLGLIDKEHGKVAVIIDDKNRGIKNLAYYIQDRYNYINDTNIRLETKIIPVSDIEKVLKTITNITSMEISLDNSLSDREVDIFHKSGINSVYKLVEAKQEPSTKTIKATIRIENNLAIQKSLKESLLSLIQRGVDWSRGKNFKVSGEDNNGVNHALSFLETKLCEHVKININNKRIVYSEAFDEIKHAYEQHFAK